VNDAELSAKRWEIFHTLAYKWVYSNKYLMRGNNNPSQFISFNESKNEITISLTDFQIEYYDKYLRGKDNVYMNGFIEKFKPILREYMKQTKIDETEFCLIFKYKLMLTYKYIKVNP
jgi:ubiquitin C-terminal hydrolase